MNTEDGAKLYDVCPHVSDSVRVAGVGGGSCSLFLWAVREKDFMAQSCSWPRLNASGHGGFLEKGGKVEDFFLYSVVVCVILLKPQWFCLACMC